MGTGFGIVGVDTWLDVVPQVETATSRPMSNTHHPPCIQIIARIQTPSANIRRNLNSLLNEVGKHHPQALIYPLTVASKSTSASRMGAAVAIMERMKEHSATIVEQVRVFYPVRALTMAYPSLPRLLSSVMSSYVSLFSGMNFGTKGSRKRLACTSPRRTRKA